MADILIRGMEMPKDRSLWLLIRPDGTVFKIKDNDKLGLPKEGAAIFLPEGHGRLIDADALQAKFELMENALAEHGRPYSFAFKDGGEMCAEWWTVQDALSREPTIVPAEGGGEDG